MRLYRYITYSKLTLGDFTNKWLTQANSMGIYTSVSQWLTLG